LEELKRQPFVAEALKLFPEAQITKVTHPSEDAGGGDVAPFPAKPTPAPSPARKKEADR
jgi:DNA polymerase III subunit gamma/tau